MKKVLIWLGCFVGLSLINLIIMPSGFILGYGIEFIILIVLPRYLFKKVDIKAVEKEAYSNGMSIRQYIASMLPPALLDFCETHKGDTSELKKVIKRVKEEYMEEEHTIPNRIFVVLYEMYK